MPLLIAAASIGAGTIAIKKAYEVGATPEGVLAARLSVAAGIALVVFGAAGRVSWRDLNSSSAPALLAAGIVLWLCWQAELIGLSHLDASVLIMLITTTPAFVVIITSVAWHVAPTGRELLGIGTIMVGVVVIAHPFNAPLNATGVAAGLATAVSGATMIVLLGRARDAPPAATLSGALIVASLLSLAVHPGAFGETLADSNAIPLVVAVGACAAAWGIFVVIGIGRTSATQAAIVLAIEPVFVALLAFVFLGERLSAVEICGGLLVLAAVALVTSGSQQLSA